MYVDNLNNTRYVPMLLFYYSVIQLLRVTMAMNHNTNVQIDSLSLINKMKQLWWILTNQEHPFCYCGYQFFNKKTLSCSGSSPFRNYDPDKTKPTNWYPTYTRGYYHYRYIHSWQFSVAQTYLCVHVFCYDIFKGGYYASDSIRTKWKA